MTNTAMQRRPPTLLLVWPMLAGSLFLSSGAAAEEPAWKELIGKGLSGWRKDAGKWINVGSAAQDPGNAKRLVTKKGSGVLVNGANGRTRNIISESQHGDIELHVEFMVPAGSNSGVYFQGRYEIQILDSWGVKKVKHGDCGGIYQRWKNGKGFEGHAPAQNASRPPGRWQSFDAIFRAPRFDAAGKKIANARFVEVNHNGIRVHQNVKLTGPTRGATFNDERATGPLMLQGDHGPVAYRNLRVRKLKIEK